MTFTVDVTHCGENTRPIKEEDWRRYIIAATNAVDAELTACQMSFAHHGRAVRSTVIDWEEDQ